MLDRLISGAGAITDIADRAVRWFTRRGGRDLLGTRPGSPIVAAALVLAAIVLGLIGAESSGDPNPRGLGAGSFASEPDLGNRTYATVDGVVHGAYVETYIDTNANDTQDPGEVGEAWYYFLVDSTSRGGLTVRSSRSPEEVFVLDVVGQVLVDPTYIEEDRDLLSAEIAERGLTLDPTYLIDTTVPPSGTTPQPLDLANVPAEGTVVSLAGSTLSYLGPSCEGIEQDPDCIDADVRYYDVILFDPATSRGIIVFTTESLELLPATFTGIVRRDERAVDDARTTPGLAFDTLDLDLSDRFLLEDGQRPTDAVLAYGLAALCLAIAGAILIGLVGRYLVYRRDRGESSALPAPSSGFAIGDRLPLHVTGLLRAPGGDVHVREVQADLVRFVTSPPPPSDGGPIAEPLSTLIVERRGRPEGVALGLGELRRLTAGKVTPLRGPRPALRAVAGTGPLLLSFDDVAARDRAAAALLDETGLTVSGGVASDGTKET